MKKQSAILLSIFCMVFLLIGCNGNTASEGSTLTIAAAASLKNVMDEQLIPMFQEKHPDIRIQATYDGSGKLKSQIEAGAPIDVFLSAAMRQMDELEDLGLVLEGSTVQLLENKIVLIVPAKSENTIRSFEDILLVDTIAIGDPASVPAGQYAEEVLTSLYNFEEVLAKASLGTNVTEVLNWVSEGSADIGIVYSTDAASTDRVKVVAEAPEGTVSKIVYPLGIVKASENRESARRFIEFLKTDEAIGVFESYGFSGKK